MSPRRKKKKGRKNTVIEDMGKDSRISSSSGFSKVCSRVENKSVTLMWF